MFNLCTNCAFLVWTCASVYLINHDKSQLLLFSGIPTGKLGLGNNVTVVEVGVCCNVILCPENKVLI